MQSHNGQILDSLAVTCGILRETQRSLATMAKDLLLEKGG